MTVYDISSGPRRENSRMIVGHDGNTLVLIDKILVDNSPQLFVYVDISSISHHAGHVVLY